MGHTRSSREQTLSSPIMSENCDILASSHPVCEGVEIMLPLGGSSAKRVSTCVMRIGFCPAAHASCLGLGRPCGGTCVCVCVCVCVRPTIIAVWLVRLCRFGAPMWAHVAPRVLEPGRSGIVCQSLHGRDICSLNSVIGKSVCLT